MKWMRVYTMIVNDDILRILAPKPETLRAVIQSDNFALEASLSGDLFIRLGGWGAQVSDRSYQRYEKKKFADLS